VATSVPLPPPILATQDRTSAAILSPTTLAVSFVAGSGANASLFTRIGFVVPGREDPVPQPTSLPAAAADTGAGAAAGGPEPPVSVYTWPTIAWGPATSYSGIHLSHAVAAMDARRYLLCFPLDDGITASAGASLVAVAASVVLPPLPAGAASAPTTAPSDPAAAARAAASDAQIVLGESAVLSGVKAHYYFDAAAMSPTRAVVVFVDASINDGIRAVLITLQPGLAVSFGATLVLNSGHAGGVSTAGSWLHLSLIPMLAPQFATTGQPLFVGEAPAQQQVQTAAGDSPVPITTASVGGGTGAGADGTVGASVRKGEVYLAAAGRNAAAAARRARGKALAAAAGLAASTAADARGAASVRGLQQWQSDDDGDAYFDDDDGYFDDDSSHVVAAQEQVGHPFALAYSNLADNGRVTVLFGEVTPAADLAVTSPQFVVSGPMASPAGGGSPSVPVQPACWASATAISASQLVVMDTRYAGAAAASAAAAAAAGGAPGAVGGARPTNRAARRARKQARRARKQLLESGDAAAEAAEPVMCAPGGMFDAPAVADPTPNGAAAASADVLHACVAAELRPGRKSGSAARGGGGAAAGGGGTSSSAVGGASGNPWPYYAVAVSNLTLVERLNRPIGIALTDAECASPVTVLMQGTFRYSAGVPQTGAAAGGQTSRRQHHMHNGTFVDAAPVGNPNPIPACNGGGGLGSAGGGSSVGGLRGVASALRSGGSVGSASGYPTGPNGEYVNNPGAAACDNSGPYTPGKAYYSDTRGRLVEGPFSGTGGDNLRDSTADSGYLTTIASRYALDGDTSASFDSYLGVATSTWDLLVKIP